MASSEGTLCPRRSPENRPTSPFNLPTFAFSFLWSPTPSPANPPLQKSNKNQLFFNESEIATSAAIYYFSSIWASKGAFRTVLGEAGSSFRRPCFPKGLFEASLELMGRAEDPLRLDHHWVIAIGAAFGRTSKNLNFYLNKKHFQRMIVSNVSRSMVVIAF